MSVETSDTADALKSAAQLWAREGGPSASSLIRALVDSYELIQFDERALGGLGQRAVAMTDAIEDWEAPARQAGWDLDVSSTVPGTCFKRDHGEIHEAASWKAACEAEGMGPERREICEHWIVSPVLGGALSSRGERVSGDFAGLTIWSRAEMGDVTEDPAIQAIAHEGLHAEQPAVSNPIFMVITDRETDIEITVRGVTIYDSHVSGHLENLEVIERIGVAAGVTIHPTDYLAQGEDLSSLSTTSVALRIAEVHGISAWILDRAPHGPAIDIDYPAP